MRILFIGGTRFVGRAMAEAAVAAGHDITLLHRGQHGSELFPDAAHLLADRDQELTALAVGEWDATIDVSAYVPRQVDTVAKALGGRGGHHVFVSTVSVYAEPTAPDADEDSALLEPPPDDVEEVTNETYGPLKVACERAAERAYGDRLAIIRPTYVIGPHDPTGRFAWWVARAARGGVLIAPGPADAPMQTVDARDMGAWAVRLAERGGSGVFTAARPWLTFRQMLGVIASATGGDATLTDVDGRWLVEQGVDGMQLPLWSEGEPEWSLAMSIERATTAGLTHRPLVDSVRDVLAWSRDAGAEPVLIPGLGIAADRESALLQAWAHEPRSSEGC
jgi:2'-hydroxyisoflavone reductase